MIGNSVVVFVKSKNNEDFNPQKMVIDQKREDALVVSNPRNKTTYVLFDAHRLRTKNWLGWPISTWIVSEDMPTPVSVSFSSNGEKKEYKIAGKSVTFTEAGVKATKISDGKLHDYIHYQRLRELMKAAHLSKLELILFVTMIAAISAVVGCIILYLILQGTSDNLNAALFQINEMRGTLEALRQAHNPTTPPNFVPTGATTQG